MKRVLVLFLCLFAVGCATHPVQKVSIPAPPPIAESAKPAAVKVSENINEVNTQNEKIKKILVDQASAISEQKEALDGALTTALKLQKDAELTSKEKFDLVENLKVVKARNLFLEQRGKTLESASEMASKNIQFAQKNIDELKDKLNVVENTSSELRRQNAFLSQTLNEQNQNVDKLNAQVSKAEKAAASASVYKHWIIGLAIALVLSAILGVAAKLYLPSKL